MYRTAPRQSGLPPRIPDVDFVQDDPARPRRQDFPLDLRQVCVVEFVDHGDLMTKGEQPSTRLEPINPAPPVTRIFIVSGYGAAKTRASKTFDIRPGDEIEGNPLEINYGRRDPPPLLHPFHPRVFKKGDRSHSLAPKPALGSGAIKKKETVRITLPQPPMVASAPAAPAELGSTSNLFVPPPAITKAPLPPPPAANHAGPPRPPGALNRRPPPPLAPGKPTPLWPTAAGTILAKPGAPKKETTRIQIPPEPRSCPRPR